MGRTRSSRLGPTPRRRRAIRRRGRTSRGSRRSTRPDLRPMKVLMTADAVGGVWTYAIELAHALQPFGVEVVLATMGRAPSEEQRREARARGNVLIEES